MNISTLEAFIAVARYQSFSRASEQMGLTQPAVSKRIAHLESDLDTVLFDRIAKQISLSEAGIQLLPKAHELVNQANELRRYASTLSDQVSGSLSMAISHHIALYRMPPILKEFNRLYPDVNLKIRFEDSEQACSAVERGDIEFAVITLPTELPARLEPLPIWQDNLHIVVGKEHPLCNQIATNLKQLSGYPCVLPTADTETHKIILREFVNNNLAMKIQMSTNNLQSLKMLVIAGIGWSVLPESMLDDQLKTLNCNLTLVRDLGLVVHRKRSLSNAANAIKQLLKHQ